MGNKLYFGEDVTKSIVRFNKEKNFTTRQKLFVEDIMPAFEKLILYHYHRSSVARNEDILHDCMAYLYEKIEKFDGEKYDRGFPYFNRIVKNFFIQEKKKESKEIQNDQYPISLTDYKQQQGKLEEYVKDGIEEEIERGEFINSFKDHLLKWKGQFKKEQEIKIVDALILIFENSHNLELYNKKAVYWYLKEITKLNSKQVTTNLTKVKKKLSLLKKKYNRGDI